jgi:hypothetical protein
LKYIGDFSFFLFDSGFSISKESVFKSLDENVLKLPPKELSILLEFPHNSEILRNKFKKMLDRNSQNRSSVYSARCKGRSCAPLQLLGWDPSKFVSENVVNIENTS